MSITINTIAGGAVSRATLAITVTNGTATSVTATKTGDSVSLVHDSTSDIWTGSVTPGTWTVTATDGTHTQTDYVTVSGVAVYELSLRLQDIPNAYTQLEYIEGNGTQYIDTGYTPTSTTKLTVTAMFISVTGYETLAGATQFCIQRNNTTTNICGDYFGTWQSANSIAAQTNAKLNFTLDAVTNKFSIGSVSKTWSRGSKTPSGTIQLLKKYGEEIFGSQRHYIAQIYNSGTLARNMYPARRNSDSVLGMYDTVNNVFYTNAGTGTFTAGPAV